MAKMPVRMLMSPCEICGHKYMEHKYRGANNKAKTGRRSGKHQTSAYLLNRRQAMERVGINWRDEPEFMVCADRCECPYYEGAWVERRCLLADEYGLEHLDALLERWGPASIRQAADKRYFHLKYEKRVTAQKVA